MQTTLNFTNQSNARRAARRMIKAGKAPASEFEIEPDADGLFTIRWLDGKSTAAIETEVATAATAADQPSPTWWGGAPPGEEGSPPPSESDVGARGVDPASGEPETDAAPSAPSPAPQPEAAATADSDPELAAFETPRLIAELERRGFRRVPARRARASAPAEPRRSKNAELDAAAARGVVPEKPDVTSTQNHHYQRRFDHLAKLAAADDWDAVRTYECNGVNSYAKEVRRYRDRLLAAHAASTAAA